MSSQLFEGFTEQVIDHASKTERNDESQKGPMASGRVLAEIFSKEQSSSELKFLEDHAYNIFESRLEEVGALERISSGTGPPSPESKFLLVEARLHLNDVRATSALLDDFNLIGEAMWRVQNDPMPAHSPKKVTSDSEARKLAAESGLQMNKKVSDAASHLIKFGFKGLIEAIMNVDGHLITAPLKRSSLREEEFMIVQKYSRFTEKTFVMLCLVTQRGILEREESVLPDVKDADGIKQAMRTLALHMGTMEGFFAGTASGEIIVDPIAIYSVL